MHTSECFARGALAHPTGCDFSALLNELNLHECVGLNPFSFLLAMLK
jgi:hypothetical protein